jgi:aminomethyltransferase
LITGTTTTLRKTALNAVHRALGAKMVTFAGWDMPVEYSGIIEEHRAVRTAAGLFDVSHMGEIEIRGREALALLQQTTSNDAARLAVGQAQYTALLTERGTVVDDVVLHKLSDSHYLLCVNAANRQKDFEHIRAQNRLQAEVEETGDSYTQLALQGPKAATILGRLAPADISTLGTYRFVTTAVADAQCLVARTGYTGEDGFEIYFDPAHSERIWEALLAAGENDGLLPAGLGARNTLRLEVAYALYGNEIDESATLWEAKLGWICKLDKGDFTGRAALIAQREKGIKRILVGFEMRDRGIARDAYPVLIDGRECGRVTSGTFAPYLEKSIGLAYVPVEAKAPGTKIAVGVRGRLVDAEIVPTPFYRRPK